MNNPFLSLHPNRGAILSLTWAILMLGFLSIFSGCFGDEPPTDAPPIETTLSGKVVDTAGQPIKVAMVTTSPATSSITTGNDGSFQIPNMKPGSYTIKVNKDGFESASTVITLKEGENTSGDIVLRALVKTETKLSGKVLDAKTGLALANANVTTIPATASVVTGVDGTFTLPNLIAGQYTVNVTKDGYQDNGVVISVKTGANTASDIKLTPTAAVLKVAESNLNFDVSNTSMNLTLSNETKVGTITWTATTDQP